MTEIAERAGAPIGSLYQFFPSKEALADTLVHNYVALLSADLEGLEARAAGLSVAHLIEQLFALLRGRPSERAVALPLVEARMDEKTRRVTFRHMVRKKIAAMLRAQAPTLPVEAAREMAVVVLQLMKAAHSLNDEEGLTGRAAGARELQALAVQYLQQRLR